MNQLVFGLEISNSKIVAIVAGINKSALLKQDDLEQSKNLFTIYGMSSYFFARGDGYNDFNNMQCGIIANIDWISAKAIQVLDEARINADCSHGVVIVNIAGSHVRNVYATASAKHYGQISEQQLAELIARAKSSVNLHSMELIDFEVQEYTIDDDYQILNPKNLVCNQVSVNLNLLIASNSQLANNRMLLGASQFTLFDSIPAPILSAMGVLCREEMESGVCVIDIGFGITNIAVYQNNFLRYINSIPIGGENITQDISIAFRLSRNFAEDIKLNYGQCNPSFPYANGQLDKPIRDINFINNFSHFLLHANIFINNKRDLKDKITTNDYLGNAILISRDVLTEIINYRLAIICKIVYDELQKNGLYDIIRQGLVITGGTTLLPNMREFIENFFSLQTRIGINSCDGLFADIIKSPRYSTVVGTMNYLVHNILASVDKINAASSDKVDDRTKRINELFFSDNLVSINKDSLITRAYRKIKSFFLM